MFEAVELGRKLSKSAFDEREPQLHSQLLTAQRQLADANFSTVVLVSGVEGAGKGGVVSLLHRWMDPRGLSTAAFWNETDEERLRPEYWRFWRVMPPKGKICVMFGSWYTQPIIDRVLKRVDQDHFDRALERIRHFEDMLVDDGTLIIKLWYHLSKRTQRERLTADTDGTGRHVSPFTKAYAKHYDRFAKISERAIRKTDVAHSPWHLVEATHPRYRDVATGEIIVDRLSKRLAATTRPRIQTRVGAASLHKPGEPTVLSKVPLNKTIDIDTYKKRLKKYQSQLYKLAWQAHEQGIDTVAVFEGWDAAGKGGAIRRVTQGMDARLYQVISIAAPTDEEKAQHYLWRFWRHIPRDGYHTIYDRSWYGRVLVERVEQFARPHEWQRAYSEINSFEEQLVNHGAVLMKFWLHIDPGEQLRRFRERETIEWKKHKITDEDWRNREKWEEYEVAVSDMVTHTSTEIAPWTLVPANDKRYARVEVIKAFVKQLKRALA